MGKQQKAAKGLPSRCSNKRRQAYFLAYKNDDRALHNQIARLVRRFRKTSLPKYRDDLAALIERSGIHIRTQYKAFRA